MYYPHGREAGTVPPAVGSGPGGKDKCDGLLGFPGGSLVKNPPATQEMQEWWVQSLGREDPLEKEMATHSSILAWESPWTEEPGGLQSMGVAESDMTGHEG